VLLFAKTLYVNGKDYTIELGEKDFDDAIKSFNFFVAFDNRERASYIKHDDFEGFWKKIARVYNKNLTGELKIGITVCKDSPKLCEDQNIHDVWTIKFFDLNEKVDWKPMAKFFNITAQEAIQTYEREKATMAKLQSGKVLTKFYAPDCSRCESLAPKWQKLESSYNGSKNLLFLSVDCKDQMNVCGYYNAEVVPTILYTAEGVKIEKYDGKLELESLEDFIEKIVLEKEKLQAAPESYVKEKAIFDVTPSNFQELISKGFTLVFFSLKNCPYCRDLNKLYDELAQRFISSRNVTIAYVNCDKHGNFCIEKAKGCPTLNVYGNGEMVKKDYYEDRSLEGLTDMMVAYSSGGKVYDTWKEGEKEKRRLRKERERKEHEAKIKK